MNNALTTIRLNGELGKKFGRVHKFAVQSVAEAVRAMSIMIPGFKRELIVSKDRGIAYAIFIGKENVGKDKLSDPIGGKVIKIAPVIQGSKNAGVFQIVLGVALVALAVFQPELLTVAGTSFAGAVGGLGASFILGGITALLSPQQKTAASATSYNFGGPVNTTAQGNPVPLLYGRLTVGSAVINAAVVAEDLI